jgi:hypothetical protein
MMVQFTSTQAHIQVDTGTLMVEATTRAATAKVEEIDTTSSEYDHRTA